MLAYSPVAKQSHLTAAGWQADPEKRRDAIKPLASEKDKSKGRVFDYFGRLHLDLSAQGRLWPGDQSIHVTLTPNKLPMFVTIIGDYSVEFKIHDARLHMHASVVSSRLQEAHDRARQINSARFPTVRTELRVKTLAAGSLDESWNAGQGRIPRRAFVVFNGNEAFNGSFKKDAFAFRHFDICHLALFADGVQYPQIAYTPDFDSGLYAREYYSLFRALDQNGTDAFMQMSMEEFAKNNVIFAFQLSPDCSNGPGAVGHLSPPQLGNLRLEMRFKRKLPEVVNVVMLMQFDSMIEVDAFGNVTTDYN